jgi:hypothetical protein
MHRRHPPDGIPQDRDIPARDRRVLVEPEIVVPLDQANGAFLGWREVKIRTGRPTDV